MCIRDRDNTRGITFKARLELSENELEVISCGGQLQYLKMCIRDSIDCMDKPDRYRGKVVEFTGMVMKSNKFPKNYFVPGRMAMTCCEADMTFLGFICKAREARNLENRQWVKVRAKIEYEEWQDYGGVGPVLYAESVEPAEPIKDIVQF